MEKYSYDRLSAQDNSFLIFDKPNAFTHAAGVQIFEAGPLRTADGGIDVEVIRNRSPGRLPSGRSEKKASVWPIPPDSDTTRRPAKGSTKTGPVRSSSEIIVATLGVGTLARASPSAKKAV